MGQYRLVCLDLDGTLLNDRKEITPYTQDIIARLQGIGVTVALTSARMPQAMKAYYQQLQLKGPMICYGGGTVWDGERVLRAEYIHPHTVERIARTGEEMGININLYQDSHWFVSRWDHWIDAEIGMVNMEPILEDYPTMLEAWRASGKGACKIMCIGEPEDIQRFYEWLVEHTAEEADTYRSISTYLEILPHGVDKASGVAFLAQSMGIPREEIFAVGDGATDACMLEYAGLGIAMGNASQAAKDAADMVALTNEEDGAARALVQAFGLKV